MKENIETFKESYAIHDLWNLPNIEWVIQNDKNVYIEEPKAIVVQKNETITSHQDYNLLFIGTQTECENALSKIKEADNNNQSITIYDVEDADNSLINHTNNSNGRKCFLNQDKAAEFAKEVINPWITIYPHNNKKASKFLQDDEALEFIKSSNINHIVSLSEDLYSNEFMKSVAEGSLKDSNDFLKNANFFTKIFKKNNLEEWQNNKLQCEKDILKYNNEISKIKKEFDNLGYNSSEIRKIRSVLSSTEEFWHYMKEDNPWTTLLNESEKSELVIEVATDRHENYSMLTSLTDYIESFETNEDKLDFIHGFMPEHKSNVNQSEAYKIGTLFYENGTTYGLDLEQKLRDYAPQYRHNIKLVSNIASLNYEETLYKMAAESLNDPLNSSSYEKSKQQLSLTEEKISSIKEQLQNYKFYGKIDFLGLNKQGETIVGETLVYNNYKDYKKEIDESLDCGRPISSIEISKEEYQGVLKENDEKLLELDSIQNYSVYIDGFKSLEQKIDFAKGYLDTPLHAEKESDAYKIGAIFRKMGTASGINLGKVLKNYAPKYRHDLEVVSLANDLRNMTINNLNEPLKEGFSPNDLECVLDQMVANGVHADKLWMEELRESKNKVYLLKEKLNTFKFFGKIDFLGQDRQGKTIVGETLVYDNYKDFKEELDKAINIGQPYSSSDISKAEYDEFIKSSIENNKLIANQQKAYDDAQKTDIVGYFEDAVKKPMEERLTHYFPDGGNYLENFHIPLSAIEEPFKIINSALLDKGIDFRELNSNAEKSNAIEKIAISNPEIENKVNNYINKTKEISDSINNNINRSKKIEASINTTIINGNSKFTVLRQAGANRLLKRVSDGQIIIAKGFNGKDWLASDCYGQEGLKKAMGEWTTKYSKPNSFGYNVKSITQKTKKTKSIHR